MHIPITGLPEFDYVKPDSLTQASRFLAEHADKARPLMGGTDLFVRMRGRFIRPQVLVDLKHLPGMRDVAYDEEAGLTVGAAVTMNQLARHPAVQARYQVLAEAANSVASYQLRNRATVGGNLCNASPAADTAPAALVLEGQVVLYGPDGERQVPANGFFTGPGQTAMGTGEFMTAIRFPTLPSNSAGRYLKLGRNKAGDLSIVGVAVFGALDGAGPRFRIALASVGPTPLRAREAEEALASGALSEEALAHAAEKTMQAASPIDDVRASAAYRKAMVRTLTLRALQDVCAQLRKT